MITYLHFTLRWMCFALCRRVFASSTRSRYCHLQIIIDSCSPFCIPFCNSVSKQSHPRTCLTNAHRSFAGAQFGPVIPVLKYTDVEEALARANDTDFVSSQAIHCRC